MHIHIPLFGCALMIAGLAAAGDVSPIYKWHDEKGNLHYSDTPPKTASQDQIKSRVRLRAQLQPSSQDSVVPQTVEQLVLPELNILESDQLSDFPNLIARDNTVSRKKNRPTAILIRQSPRTGALQGGRYDDGGRSSGLWALSSGQWALGSGQWSGGACVRRQWRDTQAHKNQSHKYKKKKRVSKQMREEAVDRNRGRGRSRLKSDGTLVQGLRPAHGVGRL